MRARCLSALLLKLNWSFTCVSTCVCVCSTFCCILMCNQWALHARCLSPLLLVEAFYHLLFSELEFYLCSWLHCFYSCFCLHLFIVVFLCPTTGLCNVHARLLDAVGVLFVSFFRSKFLNFTLGPITIIVQVLLFLL